MKNVHRILTTAVAVILCVTFTASGQQPAPTSTVDTLPQQTVSVPSQQSEPAPAVDSASSQPIEQVAIYKLNTIAQDLSDTKENTNPLITPDFWKTIAGLSLIVAIIGVIISWFNYKEQKNTQLNTRLLTPDKQIGILIDMVRHLYRNLVVTRTIETKMRAFNFQAYPSEEHLVKLQIPLEQIQLDSFLNMNFATLSHLNFVFRNYNEEIRIIKDHLKDPSLSREVKERDLETLTFKCGFLASRIYYLFNDDPEKEQEKWISRKDNNIATAFIHTIEQAQISNSYSRGNAILPAIEKAITPYENENDLFMEIFDSEEQKRAFWEGLNRDIRIECGNKQKAEDMVKPYFKYDYTTDKIYMIKLQKTNRRKNK